MNANELVCQKKKLFRFQLGSTLSRAYLALILLLGGSALSGMEMISRGEWGWCLLACAVFTMLSVIWRALDSQSGLWGRFENVDRIPMMPVHAMHVITNDPMEGGLDITATEGRPFSGGAPGTGIATQAPVLTRHPTCTSTGFPMS
jgi:hypothetical protein